jgi:hypothetical protein
MRFDDDAACPDGTGNLTAFMEAQKEWAPPTEVFCRNKTSLPDYWRIF